MNLVLFLSIFATNGLIVNGMFWPGSSMNSRQSIQHRLRPPRHRLVSSYHHQNLFQRPLIKFRRQNPVSKHVSSYAHPFSKHIHQKNVIHSQYPPHNSVMAHPHTNPPIIKQTTPVYSQYSILQDNINYPIVNPPSHNFEHGGPSVQQSYQSSSYSGWRPISTPYLTSTSTERGTGQYFTATEPLPTRNPYSSNYRVPFNGISLHSEYSENHGVAVPFRQVLEHTTLRSPPRFFRNQPNFQPPYHFPSPPPTNIGGLRMDASEHESTKSSVLPKPFRKFPAFTQYDEKNQSDHNSPPNNASPENSQPQLISKFKISRPKLKLKLPQPTNEPEVEGPIIRSPPKVTLTRVPNYGNAPLPDYPNLLKQEHDYVPKVNHIEPPKPKRILRKPFLRKSKTNKEIKQLDQLISSKPLGQSFPTQNPSNVVEEQRHNSAEPFYTSKFSEKGKGSKTPEKLTFHVPQMIDFPRPSPFSNEFTNGYNEPIQNQFSEQPNNSKLKKLRNPVRENFYNGNNEGTFDKPVVKRYRKRRPKQQIKQVQLQTLPVEHEQVNLGASNIKSDGFFDSLVSYPWKIYNEFAPNMSLDGPNPMSFMVMPNSKPQIIEHIPFQQNEQNIFNYNQFPSNSASDTHSYSIHPQVSSTQQPFKYNSYSQPKMIYDQTTNVPNSPFLNIRNTDFYPTVAPRQETITQHQHFKPNQVSFNSYYTKSPSHNQLKQISNLNSFEQFPFYDQTSTTGYGYMNRGIAQSTQTPFSNVQQQALPSNNNVETISSNEYKRIPMEFISQLSPILLNDRKQANFPIISSPTSTMSTKFQSPNTLSYNPRVVQNSKRNRNRVSAYIAQQKEVSIPAQEASNSYEVKKIYYIPTKISDSSELISNEFEHLKPAASSIQPQIAIQESIEVPTTLISELVSSARKNTSNSNWLSSNEMTTVPVLISSAHKKVVTREQASTGNTGKTTLAYPTMSTISTSTNNGSSYSHPTAFIVTNLASNNTDEDGFNEGTPKRLARINGMRLAIRRKINGGRTGLNSTKINQKIKRRRINQGILKRRLLNKEKYKNATKNSKNDLNFRRLNISNIKLSSNNIKPYSSDTMDDQSKISTTISSMDILNDPVTYGEDQWYQIKPVDRIQEDKDIMETKATELKSSNVKQNSKIRSSSTLISSKFKQKDHGLFSTKILSTNPTLHSEMIKKM